MTSSDFQRETAESGGAAGAIILGSGRSGTSAIARAFVAAGFFAGREDDLYGPDSGNPLGHYESLSVLEINEELLRERFGRRWWADTPSPEEQLPHRLDVGPRLEAMVERLIQAAGDAPLVLKEPRINGMLPLWETAIDGVLHPVLAVRDPLEIALSHSRRDGTSMSHALASWEAQTALVLGWLDGRTATIAPYGSLISRTGLAGNVVDAVVAHLEPRRASVVQSERASSALRSDLHRQHAADLDRAGHLTGHQSELWSYLEALPPGNSRLSVPESLRQPSPAALATTRKESERVELAEEHATLVAKYGEAMERGAALENAFAQATELSRQAVEESRERAQRAEVAAQAANTSQTELEAIKRSASWRLTGPLRWINALLPGVETD